MARLFVWLALPPSFSAAICAEVGGAARRDGQCLCDLRSAVQGVAGSRGADRSGPARPQPPFGLIANKCEELCCAFAMARAMATEAMVAVLRRCPPQLADDQSRPDGCAPSARAWCRSWYLHDSADCNRCALWPHQTGSVALAQGAAEPVSFARPRAPRDLDPCARCPVFTCGLAAVCAPGCVACVLRRHRLAHSGSIPKCKQWSALRHGCGVSRRRPIVGQLNRANLMSVPDSDCLNCPATNGGNC